MRIAASLSGMEQEIRRDRVSDSSEEVLIPNPHFGFRIRPIVHPNPRRRQIQRRVKKNWSNE
jgi:hypothetical protein